MATTTPLGYRNNNPGNLVKGPKPFLGEIFPSKHERFRQFTSMEYGYRAGLKNLLAYISGGYNTIEKIITRWAPSFENNTKAYIAAVSKQTGINPKTILTSANESEIIKIMAAISQHENGLKPDLAIIMRGWDLIGDKKKRLISGTGVFLLAGALIAFITKYKS